MLMERSLFSRQRYDYNGFAIGVDRSQGTLSWFSLKENHSSRTLWKHSNCETALALISAADVATRVGAAITVTFAFIPL
jgi:hypothetical protein